MSQNEQGKSNRRTWLTAIAMLSVTSLMLGFQNCGPNPQNIVVHPSGDISFKTLNHTCPEGMVLCKDGSCAPMCDGIADNCPEGMVLCKDGFCAPMCDGIADNCPQGMIMCKDGSCAPMCDGGTY